MNLKNLETEQRNPRTMHIDSMSTLDMVRTVNQEDAAVTQAVETALPDIARLIDGICERLQNGGSLYYIGAGTSGRLGILDAVECPPTYSTEPELVQGLIAGGTPAIFRAVEGAEDDPDLGRKDLEEIHYTKQDVLVGIAASGRTPYVIGAMEYAKSLGGVTIGVTCCPGSEIDTLAEVGIAPMPGPEVVTGSTRMKSGTAQKMVLNMLSTCTMIRLGKVYGNLMVDVKPSNEKLIRRCVSIVCAAAECDEAAATAALEQCGYHPKIAIVMLLCGCTAEEAEKRLTEKDGYIARVVG